MLMCPEARPELGAQWLCKNTEHLTAMDVSMTVWMFADLSTSELVIRLVAGQHFTDGLLGADSHPGVEKHRPLWPTCGHLEPWTFSLCGRPQQLHQTSWAGGLRLHRRVQPDDALWTGNRQAFVQGNRWVVFTTKGQTANVTRFRHLKTVKTGFTVIFFLSTQWRYLL